MNNLDVMASHTFLKFVYEFYKTMKSREISLVYEGEVTHQLTKTFKSMTESSMNKEDEPGSVQRQVNHVLIECLQNISKHADDVEAFDNRLSGRGIFMISKATSEYAITTGNAIENSKLETLRTTIEHVNNSTKEELDEMYSKQILEGEISEKGGAGLGLIDIVRKTGRKLEYSFMVIDDKISFFILTSFVSRKK